MSQVLGALGHLPMNGPISLVVLRRATRAASRGVREWRMIAKGLLSTRHPIDAHIIPIRRCNLSCAYCNEFDSFSKPVPTAEMLRRIDRLAALGTTIITISGGEPLLHPELDEIIRRIRRRGSASGWVCRALSSSGNR